MPHQVSLAGEMGSTKMFGTRQIEMTSERNIMLAVLSDMSAVSRTDSGITNMRMPWEKKSESPLLSVGVLEAWKLEKDEKKGKYLYNRISYKCFFHQSLCFDYNPSLRLIFVGFDTGKITAFKVDFENKDKIFEKTFSHGIHKKRVVGLKSDSNNMVLYSIGGGGWFKVFNIARGVIIHGKKHSFKKFCQKCF